MRHAVRDGLAGKVCCNLIVEPHECIVQQRTIIDLFTARQFYLLVELSQPVPKMVDTIDFPTEQG